MFSFFTNSEHEFLSKECQKAIDRKDLRAALYLADRAVESDPSDKSARLRRGQLLIEIEKQKKAIPASPLNEKVSTIG